MKICKESKLHPKKENGRAPQERERSWNPQTEFHTE